MYSDTPGTIRLAGTLGDSEMANLIDYCDRLSASGCTRLSMNLDAVVDCERAGLDGLAALTTRAGGPTVTISGAHWGQFMVLLSEAPIGDVQPLCDSIRSLLSAIPTREHPAHRAPPPTPDDPPTGSD